MSSMAGGTEGTVIPVTARGQPVRVVVISKTFVADTAQRQLEWLARQPGIELTLITPPVWNSDHGRALPFVARYTEGYAVREVPVVFNGRYHFYVYRDLGRVVRDLTPNIVHIDEEPYNPAGAQAQRAASAVGARTVFVAWQNLWRAYPPPFSLFERYNYARTAHVIAGNVAAGEVVRRKGYRGPLSTFSMHGVDPDIYRPQPRRMSDGTFVVGYIGRMVEYKGVGLLIDALTGLPDTVRLRLRGSGPDEAALRARAVERGVANRVEFLPFVPTTEVPAAMAEFDVMALPSISLPTWKEQFGRTLIEAMACGVPVLGSDSGEIPNVVGDAGVIVPEGDVGRLSEALAALAADPARRDDLAQRGLDRVRDTFTQEHVARRIAEVYSAVLATASGRLAAGASGR